MDETPIRKALEARAKDIVHLKTKFGLEHEIGLGLVNLLLNYDVTLKQMGINPVEKMLGEPRGKTDN